MRRTYLEYFLFFILILITISIGSVPYKSNSDPQIKKCTLVFNTTTLHAVQIAETLSQQEKGLSGENPTDPRMFFKFSKPAIVTFWMRDTTISLSIGFLSKDGILYKIEDMEPETDTPHSSKKSALYALELPRNKFKDLGLHIGDKLTRIECEQSIPDVIPSEARDDIGDFQS